MRLDRGFGLGGAIDHSSHMSIAIELNRTEPHLELAIERPDHGSGTELEPEPP